ncbi:MAG: class I SAM-dependent methyltransferase [Succiniclasticum sp.]|nr:class I SAM-dependent methyltransferase [Succiniclasticum sp.]
MGLFRKFVNNTRKPEGLLGSIMIWGMNVGHARMAKWGMNHFPQMDPKTILDIGCGGGRNASELLKKYQNATLTAIDYSPLSVAKTKAYNRKLMEQKRCIVQEANVVSLPFENGAFDLATAFETIYFWTDLPRCFIEIRRILKNGGYFCIVSESDGTDIEGQKYEKIIEGMKNYTVPQIMDTLYATGFGSVRSFHHETKPWIIVIAEK